MPLRVAVGGERCDTVDGCRVAVDEVGVARIALTISTPVASEAYHSGVMGAGELHQVQLLAGRQSLAVLYWQLPAPWCQSHQC